MAARSTARVGVPKAAALAPPKVSLAPRVQLSGDGASGGRGSLVASAGALHVDIGKAGWPARGAHLCWRWVWPQGAGPCGARAGVGASGR